MTRELDHSNPIERLTDEQMIAAGSDNPRVFLEAAPGSGKTTVAANRFGVRRYRISRTPSRTFDGRAVIAVSFTRSATRELRARVRTTWGTSDLPWPHRITTLDALIYELVRSLLGSGLIAWPGGHTALTVHDTWKVLVEHEWTRSVAQVYLFEGKVSVRTTYDESGMRPVVSAFEDAIALGLCTHDDVRRVLDFALKRPEIWSALRDHVANTIRALIVDEVFDANELDIAVIELATGAGVDVTLIGDPWQALYGFRGARPDLVPGVLQKADFRTLKLTKSFRWRTEKQRELAETLRSGSPVELGTITATELIDLPTDVVLAPLWDQLWSAATTVLPIAWGSAKGNIVEAATTVLLNHCATVLFATKATYLNDALSTLGVDDTILKPLEPGLTGVLELVEAAEGKNHWRDAYDAMVGVLGGVCSVGFPKVHANYLARLKLLQPRLRSEGNVVPGMTIHQAKGREWDNVACRFTDSEVAALAGGLTSANEKHRQLYVACTRARFSTRRLIVTG